MSDRRAWEERLRAAFAARTDLPGDAHDCPDVERILDSVDGRLGAAENQAVIRHLGECAACSAAWWMAREMAEAPQPEAVPRPAVGLTVLRQRWVPLAAAAVLVALVGMAAFHLLRPRETAPPVYREQEEAWLASALPPGQPLARTDGLLRWTAGPAGTTYDLQVTDADLEILATAWRLAQAEYRLYPEALEGVAPGAVIHWRVTAHLPDGRRAVSHTFVTIVE
jgi:hypothetical protein